MASKVLRAGLELGTVKKNRFRTSPGAGPGIAGRRGESCCDTKFGAGDDRAVRYLGGEPAGGRAGGGRLVSGAADGYPLGWEANQGW